MIVLFSSITIDSCDSIHIPLFAEEDSYRQVMSFLAILLWRNSQFFRGRSEISGKREFFPQMSSEIRWLLVYADKRSTRIECPSATVFPATERDKIGQEKVLNLRSKGENHSRTTIHTSQSWARPSIDAN
jgi:hypothetical protein